jgi:phosphoglycerate dehydrogenase-like enzyme
MTKQILESSKQEHFRIAVLDDYQNVAISLADWSVLDARATVTVFNDHLADSDAVVERLQPFDIVCVMRERTPMTRTIIERLPKLRMISSTGTGLVGAPEFALMKPTARLVNTSRGPIVVEADLIAALKARKIAGAAIDVFDQEPLPPDHPFRTLANLLATPHIGYVSRGLYTRFYQDTVENIRRRLDGQAIGG